MNTTLYAGWCEVDITPENVKVELTGQYYQRVSTEIHSRLKATVLVLEQADEASAMISLDLIGIPGDVCLRFQHSISTAVPALEPERIIINAIHTHNAPTLGKGRNWWTQDPDAIHSDDYCNFVEERLCEAVKDAWKSRQISGTCNCLDYFSIGHCRRVIYDNKEAEMYGQTNCDNFSGLEGNNDAGVELLFLCNKQRQPSGVIVNVACPSQIMEATYKISSDFMGALREKLKQEFGPNFKMLSQISAAGCQAPRDLTRNNAAKSALWREEGVELISQGLLNLVTKCWQKGSEEINFQLQMVHHTESLKLPKRTVSYSSYVESISEFERLEQIQDSASAYKEFCEIVHHNETIPNRPGPYDNKNHHFVQIRNHEAVIKRYEEQFQDTELTIQLHVLKLGNVVFVTNPFELFLEYGQSIKSRSAASQTFVIQLANGYEGYLPSYRAEQFGGYGAMVINGRIGSDGGHKLVDRSVGVIKLIYQNND